MTTKSLRVLGLRGHYRSDSDDVVREFYVPVLRNSVAYSRAVGYFTSTSLALVGRGLGPFRDGGGTIRLIASPQLDADDIADLERGYSIRTILARAVERELSPDDELVLDGLGVLGRMVATGQLEVKLAFVSRDGRTGIYHEKMGYFVDPEGERIAFTGSSNETLGGLLANFESLEVYQPWIPGEGGRVQRIVDDFERLWENQTVGLRVESFPEVARERLIEIGRSRPAVDVAETDSAIEALTRDHLMGKLDPPVGVALRPYQRTAIEAWMANGARGVLKMATGTGKTKTAMFASRAVARVHRRREEPLVVVIVAPFQHLVDQWIREAEAWGAAPVGIYEASDRWISSAELHLRAAAMGQRELVVLVATNASFSGESFQRLLGEIGLPLLIVGDEVHNLGARRMLSAMPENATYRLGLSATPERWFDDVGTAGIAEFFGPIVFEFGLRDAIESGALCRYEYFPRIVELIAPEVERYSELTRKIGALMASGVDEDDEVLGALLRRRAGVLGHAAGKVPTLATDLRANLADWYQLVYCAEGTRPVDEGDPAGPRQMDDVIDLIGNKFGRPVARYVSETTRPERLRLLGRFGSGSDLQFLASMRCLDEGVDLPDARVAYILASSSNPRQFVQRRGRILRPAPGKDVARIYDYIVVPPDGAAIDFATERRLMSRELERASEFAALAENFADSLHALRPLKQRYQLMDI